MKPIKIMSPQQKGEEINWSKSMWVQGINSPDTILLTTGAHTSENFEATCLPNNAHEYGAFSSGWEKSKFKPLRRKLTIKISN